MAARPRRRDFLAAAGLLVAAGCTSAAPVDAPGRGRALPSAVPPTPRSIEADLRLLASAVTAERRIVRRYADALRRHPERRGYLRPILDDHLRHLAALQGRPMAGGRGRGTQGRTSMTALIELERAAARARGDDALAAHSGRLARLLAAIGASEAQHAVWLAGDPAGDVGAGR